MDTENFVLERSRLAERMRSRREQDLSRFPHSFLDGYGVSAPTWAKIALSLVSRGGALSRLLEVGLPLALPFLFSRQKPLVERLLQRFFSAKS